VPQRRARPVRFSPKGCSDAVDGSNAFPGAMALLTNLVPDPAMAGSVVPRPGAFKVIDFATLGFATPGFVSSELVIGNLCYGTIASGRDPGHDEPFCVDLLDRTAVAVSGIASANTPVSPPATGAWTPPIIAQVGSRVVVTHPGFPGGPVKFGWFDVSGFTETVTADLTIGSPVVSGNPFVDGVQPGMTVTGGGMPAGTTVLSTTNFVLTETATIDGVTVNVTGLASTSGVAIGQAVGGAGIAVGTTVATVGLNSVTLSLVTLAAGTTEITFSGTTITMSANAPGSGSFSLTIRGGSVGAPLWGAGDTDINRLPSVPVGVAQFNGRAYYALGLNGVVFSDSGFACRVSNNPFVQALTTDDGLAVTAVAPLMLSSPLVTTGIVQALLVFEGVSKIQQITGDPSTSNLSMNALPVATGTAAPLTITTCELGTAFVSPEGLRIVEFNGTISTPIGDAGSGVTLPFVYSAVPSRMCAAATAHTIRISTQNGAPSPPGMPLPQNPPQQEWWWDIGRKIWTGPMSFPASMIQPWAGVAAENTFVMAPVGVPATLWVSDVVPYPSSIYVENGRQLSWKYQPTALPDNGEMAMNALVDMAISAQFLNYNSIVASATDIDGTFLDTTSLPAGGQAATYFDQATGKWASLPSTQNVGNNFQQFPVYWHRPITFKQLSVAFSGQSHFGIRLANLNMRYQITGYPLPVPPGIVTWAGPASP
jgi:hypothetical protein